jgi:hypothetical protein
VIPAQLVVASLLGWLQRGQSEAIVYLREENGILKAQLRNPYQPSRRQGQRSSPSGRRIKKARDPTDQSRASGAASDGSTVAEAGGDRKPARRRLQDGPRDVSWLYPRSSCSRDASWSDAAPAIPRPLCEQILRVVVDGQVRAYRTRRICR